MYRIGQGIDFHQLVENVPLIIGNVTIPFHKGSEGHSDGDVLFHALTDAIFGSIGAGDLGFHFPSTSSKWKDADSTIFLKYAVKMLKDKKYKVVNTDSTIILQKPKISAYIPKIKKKISQITDCNNVSVKSTTTDYLGFVGNSMGICAISNVLICKDS